MPADTAITECTLDFLTGQLKAASALAEQLSSLIEDIVVIADHLNHAIHNIIVAVNEYINYLIQTFYVLANHLAAEIESLNQNI